MVQPDGLDHGELSDFCRRAGGRLRRERRRRYQGARTGENASGMKRLGEARSDGRDGLNSSGGVGQVEVRVGVHRQANVAVPHELLRDAGRDTVTGQERGEGVPQAVHVEGPALSVALGNPSGRQVEVERPQEVPAWVEQRRIRRNLAAVRLG